MDLSYLIDTVMNDICPLDWDKVSQVPTGRLHLQGSAARM
jgi:hypothetical protein